MEKLNASIKDVKDNNLIKDYKASAAEAMKKMTVIFSLSMVISS